MAGTIHSALSFADSCGTGHKLAVGIFRKAFGTLHAQEGTEQT